MSFVPAADSPLAAALARQEGVLFERRSGQRERDGPDLYRPGAADHIRDHAEEALQKEFLLQSIR